MRLRTRIRFAGDRFRAKCTRPKRAWASRSPRLLSPRARDEARRTVRQWCRRLCVDRYEVLLLVTLNT